MDQKHRKEAREGNTKRGMKGYGGNLCLAVRQASENGA